MNYRKLRVPVRGSERRPSQEIGHVVAIDPQEQLTITISLKPGQPIPEFNQGHLHPHERKLYEREDFWELYRADSKSIEVVVDFAHQHGLTIICADALKRIVVVRGTVQNLSQAFGVYLTWEVTDDKRFRSLHGPIYLPRDVSKHVKAVFGFDDRPPNSTGLPRPNLGNSVPFPPYSRFATEVSQIYQFPPGDGTGQVIGLLQFGGGYQTADLAPYFAAVTAGQIPSISAVSINGQINSPGKDQDRDREVTMDLQIASAVAPGAKFVVYFSDWSAAGIEAALNYAVNDSVNKPTVISCSWGWPENDSAFWSDQSISLIEQHLCCAAHLNITVLFGSGDTGTDDGCLYPSSSAYSLAVGGTSLPTLDTESVWNSYNGYATGGGISSKVAPVAWQSGLSSGDGNALTGRGLPDVSACADPGTGYRFYFKQGWTTGGGTSAATPLWAGLIARLNQNKAMQLGFINPLIYGALKSTFHDITSGNNGAFRAQPGWDCCTGWGTPNGNAISAAL